MDEFQKRKQDHIQWALDSKSQSSVNAGFDQILLHHEALPDLNFSDIHLKTDVRLGQQKFSFAAPFFISSMTAGHNEAFAINRNLAVFAQEKNILMGIGSQRKELTDSAAHSEWKKLRAEAPRAVLFGNLGISEIITHKPAEIYKLMDSLQAAGFFVHTNPLQEVFQKESSAQFKNSWASLEKFVKDSPVPVVIKEVGQGFSVKTLQRLNEIGVAAVDVSGLGGTHWGRIEGLRLDIADSRTAIWENFSDWGFTTVESLLNAKKAGLKSAVWASGGIRNSIDIAKCLVLGAQMVGMARPWLQAVTQSPDKSQDNLQQMYLQWENELKTVLFCMGHSNCDELKDQGEFSWRKK